MQLHRARERFEEAGVRLALIGQATPRQAAHFRRKLEIDLPILADEQRATYKAAGWRKGNMGQLVGPKSVAAGVKHSARSGVMQGKVIGDAAQLGGAMIVQSDGTVSWSQKQEHAGDTIEVDDLLAAAGAA